MRKIHLVFSIILFTTISINLLSVNEIFAEIDTDKSIYSKGELVKISGNIDQLDASRINILEIEITDSDNDVVVNEYTPLNDDNEFFSSYDTITWKTGSYKATINFNDIEESVKFEIRTSSSENDNNRNNESSYTNENDSDAQQELQSQSSSNVIPNPPINLKADVVSSEQIDLSWSLSDDNDSSITGFKIEARINTDPNYSVVVTNTGGVDTVYSHTGLIPDTVYVYRVSSINSTGESEPSGSTTVKTPDSTDNISSSNTEIENTDIPTNVVSKAISPTSVELSWNPPTQTYGQVIYGYTIKQEIASDIYDEIANTGDSNTNYTLSNLETDQTYTFVVVANYLAGSSDVSEDVRVTLTSSNLNNSSDENNESNTNEQESSSVTPDDVPDKPVELKVKSVSSTQMDLSWSAPQNNSDNNNSLTSYKIEVRTINESSYSIVDNTESTDTSYSHDSLIPNTTYIYRVYAINEFGTSEPSSEILANTLISDPEDNSNENNNSGASQYESSSILPSSPFDLQATPISQSRINLSWSAPIDIGESSLVGYKIEFKTNNELNYSILVTNSGSASTTVYSHTGLTPGLTYQYRISAINSSGESSPSEISEATITLTDSNNDQPETQQQATTLQPLQVTLSTDKSVYGPNETIEISGTTNNSSQTIPLGIRVVSSENLIVYARSISISDDKTFESIITPSQRESSSWQGGDGKFTVEVTYNGCIQATSTFENVNANTIDKSKSLSPNLSETESNKNQIQSSTSDSTVIRNNELETMKSQNNALQSANQQLQDENNKFRTEIKELHERIEQLDIIVKEQIRVMLETLGIS